MHFLRFSRVIVILAGFGLAISARGEDKPPSAKIVPVETDYFGTKISDPYRWMEAGTSDPQFLKYLKSQNAYSRAQLASLKGRDALLARIEQLDNAVPVVRSWARGGTSLFYLQAPPGAKTASLFVREADGKSRLLLDPVSLEEKGKHAAIDYYQPSWDGKYVIAGVSLGGSENSTIHVIDASNGHRLPETISRTQYAGPSWRSDSRAFVYARLQKLAPNAPPTAIYENEKVFLHVLGSDVDNDPVIFGPGVSPTLDIPKAGFVGGGFTPGSNYLLGVYSKGTTDPASFYIAPADTATPTARWQRVTSSDDMVSSHIDSAAAVHGSTLYLIVEKAALNRKLISVDLDHPDIAHASVIVPASDTILEGVYAAQDGLYLLTKIGVSFELLHSSYGPTMNFEKVPLPYAGTISSIDSNILLPGVIFRLETWTNSDQAYTYDPATNQVTNTGLIQKHPADVSGIEAREVEATSADGTKVPLSIICQKGLALDGTHPALYEGYGSYGLSIDPYFDPRPLAFVEKGGVFAFAHVRGGGELGESWHLAGQKETKQHTIDDMVAVAHYLIDQHYTSPAHLAVQGTSAGGIAVGGAIVQHPELFVAGIDNVGMTDMLRFQTTQGGAANVPEFGDINDATNFKYMYPVSAYEHVVDGTSYPAVLGITGANDPRVPSWEVGKMIARLQAATHSERPILLRVDFDAGHGLGSSRPQRESLLADIYSFVFWQSGDPEFQPAKVAAKN